MSSHAIFVSAAAHEEKRQVCPPAGLFFLVVFLGGEIARDIFSVSINDPEPELHPTFLAKAGIYFVTVQWTPPDIVAEDHGR